MRDFYYNHYVFDDDKKYLIYYRGCFEPPHKGHFSLINDYINEGDIKYFVHQMPGGNRHGIPYKVKRKIWDIYISELLLDYDIIVKRMGVSIDVLKYIEDVDIVILIRGNEDFDREKEKDMYKRYAHLRRALRKQGIPLHFLIIDRPELETLSATRFVEAIEKSKSCQRYVPEGLSKKSYKYIISQLKKYILK